MIKRSLITIGILIITLMSCNYKLFVNERYVVQSERGYLVFRDGETTFYPTRDTIDAKFLSDYYKRTGYKIDYATDWLDSLSINYSNTYIVENAKFSLIPVEITYYLGDVWQQKSERNSIEYKWDSKTFTLHFKQHDWRRILMIAVVRDSDRRRLAELKTEPPPLHY